MMTRDESVHQLSRFLESNTNLIPSIARTLANRLYDQGWRLQDDTELPLVTSSAQADKLMTVWAAKGHPYHAFAGNPETERYCRECAGGPSGIQHQS